MEIKEKKYSELRAEIWKKAFDPSIKNKKNLIQDLLDTVGPAMEVSRISYLPLDLEKKAYVSELQWVNKGINPSLGEEISLKMAENFYGHEWLEIPKDIEKIIRTSLLRETIKKYAYSNASTYYNSGNCSYQ